MIAPIPLTNSSTGRSQWRNATKAATECSENRIDMIERKSPIALLKLISAVAFLLYGLYCVATQSAYCPATSRDDYLYTRMDGPHAIAFGASLILIAVCVGTFGRFKDNHAKNQIAWMIRVIGIATAMALGWYGLLGGTNVE